mmetsp:Transcript_5878/g.8722  ORF Transcript_5878/g.8722 Transcript_5878/m.8722 type:complete len:112 (-) Transcript_5878:32-367(-)|eukprot:CAMPEP_0202434080 /NCGR_PEP_ID=MMETSP1345-20130828/14150_1 /ASSEMBLY_ACC=CAM_ASM_000843 /TAXON_ID=342563 /ORGANISM="Fabrea Fabrea salina" /LENGTH=111 /DNA_ID=CAMNT_0049046625 /DNA_START=354 /DNA_END=689 /DNA_ORIENTATION=-
MADLDDDEILIDELGTTAKNVMEGVITPDLYFQPENVNSKCQQIIDQCLKEFHKLNKPFKYIVTCFIMQRTGAGYQSASTCYWDTKTDGLISVTGEFLYLNCLVTIYAVHV